MPSISLPCPGHRLHLKLGSGFREPGILLYFLWTQLEQIRLQRARDTAAFLVDPSGTDQASESQGYYCISCGPNWNRSGFREPGILLYFLSTQLEQIRRQRARDTTAFLVDPTGTDQASESQGYYCISCRPNWNRSGFREPGILLYFLWTQLEQIRLQRARDTTVFLMDPTGTGQASESQGYYCISCRPNWNRSGFREPGILLHSLWTQLEQPPLKMEFVPRPLRHTHFHTERFTQVATNTHPDSGIHICSV